MNPLKWVVELVDKMSGPSGKISRSLREVSGGMAEMREKMGPLDAQMGAASAAGDSFTKTLSRLGSALFFVVKAGLVLGGVGFFKELPGIIAAFKGANTGGIRGWAEGLRAAAGQGGQALTRMGESFFDRLGLNPKNVRRVGGRVAAVGAGLAVAAVSVWAIKSAFDAVFGVVQRVASAVGRLVDQFARSVLQARLLREQTVAALSTITGSHAEGVRITNEIRELAHFMGSDLQETARSVQNLMAGGFNQSRAFEIFQAIQDLRIIDPDASADNITRAIRQIQSKGVLQMEELQQQLADSGVNVGDVISRIGQSLGGISDADVRKRISAGRVSSEVGIQGILESIQARAGGGPLGALARQRSLSLGGMLQRLRNAPGIIFDAIAAQGDAAFGGLRGLLEDIAELLNPTSASFQKMIRLLGAGFTTIVEVLRTAWELGRAFFEGLLGSSSAEDPLESIRSSFVDLGEVLAKLRDPENVAWMRKFGRMVRPVAEQLLYLAGAAAIVVAGVTALIAMLAATSVAIVTFAGAMAQELGGLAQRAWEWGTNIVDGLIGGIFATLGRLRGAATTMAQTVKNTVVGALEIGSPSRVMEQIGEWTGEGFSLGLNRSMPDLDGAVVASMPRQSAGAASGGIVLNGPLLHVEVTGGGDPESIAEAVRRIALSDLQAAFEQLATELGMA